MKPRGQENWNLLLRKDVLRKSEPPIELAVQLAGANFCASLSHRIYPTPIQGQRKRKHRLVQQATEEAMRPVRESLSRHYGGAAQARGAQKPLGLAFRSIKDRRNGVHSGRARSIWKRAKVNRRWCARCSTPLLPRLSLGTVWIKKENGRSTKKRVCQYCLRKQLKQSLPCGPTADKNRTLHLMTPTAVSSCTVKPRRRKRKRGKKSEPVAPKKAILATKQLSDICKGPLRKLREKRVVEKVQSEPPPPVAVSVDPSPGVVKKKSPQTDNTTTTEKKCSTPVIPPVLPRVNTKAKSVPKKENKKEASKVKNLLQSLGL